MNCEDLQWGHTFMGSHSRCHEQVQDATDELLKSVKGRVAKREASRQNAQASKANIQKKSSASSSSLGANQAELGVMSLFNVGRYKA